MSLHRHRDVRAIAYVLATDGAAVLNCDRVAVVQRDPARVLAVTGVAAPDPRAAENVSLLAISAEAVPESGATDWLNRQTLLESHQCRTAESTPGWTKIQRVDPPQDAAGTLRAADLLMIAEVYSPVAPDSAEVNWNRICEHAGVAFATARQFENASLWGRIRLLLRNRFRMTLTLAAMLFAVALFCIPARFEISVRGQLIPQQRQFIYAPVQGRITDVHVKNEQDVGLHGPLFSITSPALERELVRVKGEKLAASARLSVLQAARNDPSAGRPAVSEAELNELIRSLENQQLSIQAEMDGLRLTAPFAGRVFLEDVSVLRTRPVEQGERLLELANVQADWHVKLRVPDAVVRHVAEAVRKQPDVSVRFVLRALPTHSLAGRLNSLGTAVELDDFHELTVAALVRLPADQLPTDIRPGMDVVARIDCGTRAVGYVWFRELLDFIRLQILF